ncbi:PRC-barrel domain protein [Variibacter gotjawalensis]|uniref:PRC-barrel domain protein n=1 Tax=Variibacter gotjawalensis TaxID=1333996 RepID=A0A0S3PTM0_9BRAD|nr:PRC-barrel domain-containing protein [Variibacter gotjawalensis]NIK49620.1 sporulation protein YlmC with PRC-barrel domain [Variibacter gotjawalensis]RZS45632.1 PRC-barrel domain protein [Variibacter gotjawalensis]BAT59303.1 PRC-barrel domain protein [Variibacter gotjawalensis]
MLKQFVTATAISGLMISGAFAQTSAPSSAPPAAEKAQAAPVDASKFVAAQKPDQWLATKFSGTDVLGPDNKKVGDVNDLVFGKDGKIEAVVVGVGGFLGIGQKDVALPMTAFEVVPASTSDANTGASSSTAAPSAAASNDPNDVKLKIAMTKEQLQNAPAFERYKAPAPARSTTAPGGGGAMGGGSGARPQ